MRIDFLESFIKLASAIIILGQTRTRVVESLPRMTTRERKLSSTLMKNLGTFKVNKSTQESLQVHDSFRPNEHESLHSHPRLAQALCVQNTKDFLTIFGHCRNCSQQQSPV